MFDTFTMWEHQAAFGEDSRFVDVPDEETAPDPDCAGMPWPELVEYIYDYEQWVRQMEDEHDRMRYDY